MKSRSPLWLTLALCAGCLALASVRAQEAERKPEPEAKEQPVLTEYPYLPNRYGEPFIPSVADWQALRLTALGASTTRLTEEFSRQHLTCFATPKGLVLTLDLLPEPAWKFSAPGGRFTAPPDRVKPDLQKAVDTTVRFVRNFFPEVRNESVQIRLYIKSESIGAWEGGKLTLNVEKPAQGG